MTEPEEYMDSLMRMAQNIMIRQPEDMMWTLAITLTGLSIEFNKTPETVVNHFKEILARIKGKKV